MYQHKRGNLVACICEGNAEEEILELLIEHDKLSFSYDDLLDGFFKGSMRKAKNLESRYLTQSFEPGQKIEIVRVVDSKNEKYVISHDFRDKVEGEVTNCYTRPEIEILLIIYLGKYEEYTRSRYKKPSDYCKSELKYGKKLKSKGFVYDFFASDIDGLISTLKKYHQISNDDQTIYSLIDSLNT